MTDPLLGLLEESRQLGFLGPGPVEPHIHHSLAFAEAVEAPARALDLGAGGGLPGLVLAHLVWPTTLWTFVDAQARRTEFLDEAVGILGLADRVVVVTGRTEEVARHPDHRGGYDLVTARSFAAPGVTAECAAPLLRPGGHLVVSEPPAPAGTARWPIEGLAELGLGPAEELVVDADRAPVHMVRIRCVEPSSDRYPRRTGIPTKRPLF